MRLWAVFKISVFFHYFIRNPIIVSNSVDPDQAGRSVRSGNKLFETVPQMTKSRR